MREEYNAYEIGRQATPLLEIYPFTRHSHSPKVCLGTFITCVYRTLFGYGHGLAHRNVQVYHCTKKHRVEG
jgi:hypothetical protein